jgi:hypothetical protein
MHALGMSVEELHPTHRLISTTMFAILKDLHGQITPGSCLLQIFNVRVSQISVLFQEAHPHF